MDIREEEKSEPKVEDIFGEQSSQPERPTEQPRPVEVEKRVETQPEAKPTAETKPKQESEEPTERPGASQPPTASPTTGLTKSETFQQVEKILEEDLLEMYQQMDENQKQNFKIEGEKAAGKIEILLNETKLKVKNIVRVIVDWLKMIPGINNYFLEQEAKIKTDKIISLKQKDLE